ncbi:MFS transporter [Streptomyces sp. NRRL S-350]|uniref:MFS transporter n=1 Tax=Streptomyces sp. NRRL S-350 TaxID=1463902 RepID=UPI000689A48D|nr:MFS transporter [Streptomyces sp. NRRL S-350]
MTTAAGDPPIRSFRPLAGVLAATVVSVTGTRVSAIALPWFVLATTGSATMTGLVAFAEMAPYVLVKALTGPVVDRLGPRVVSWTTDAVSAAAAGLVPLLHSQGLLPFWVLLVMVAVIGSMRGPGDLAKSVMVPEAADRARVPMERATGLSGVTERLASTIGPAVGGGLVALMGPLAGLAINAATFALGSLIIALALPRGMGRPPAPATPVAGEEDGQGKGKREQPVGYWRMFHEGFAFLRSEPLLLAVIVMVGITNLLDAGFTTVLVPVWARESGNGPAAIGLTAGAMGATAVVGSLIAAAVASRLPRRTVFFVGFLLCGAPRFLVLAVGAPMWAVLAVFAIGGFGSGFLNPILGAVLFERVPRPLLGRVHALGDSLAWAGIPLGGLVAGTSVALVGLVPSLLAAGAGYLVTTTVAGLRPEWREMDRLRGRAGGNGWATVEPGEADAETAEQEPSPTRL